MNTTISFLSAFSVRPNFTFLYYHRTIEILSYIYIAPHVFFFSILKKKKNQFNSAAQKYFQFSKKKKFKRGRDYNNGFNHKTGCEFEPVKPNLLLFQKL